MINNSAMSSSMNVADLAPKAATKHLPARQGDNAFGEALAGAHTVHDRRESQAADNSRRDWAQGDRSTERTRGQDRARDVRSDAADRTDRPDRADDDVEATATDTAPDTTAPTATADDTSATTTTQTGQSDDAATATTHQTTDTDAAATDASATVAVAAAPVVTDLDAIIVPTSTTVTHVATDAVDAAIRLAIDPAATASTATATPVATTATATTTVAATTTATTTTTTTVAATDVDVDAQLAAATNARGAEDAETGDVPTGPTRPTTSAPATTSGPSPVQLAAATFSADEAAAPTTTPAQGSQAAQVAQVATSSAADVAAGTKSDAATTQLVQAAAVDADASLDTEAAVADDAVVLKAKADAATTQIAANADAEIVDAEDPDVVQAARLNQAQAPTVAVNAQAQAQAAKAAEAAADEGSDAAPAKLEPLPSQAAPIATAARGEGIGAALRMREGLQAQVQERIDHIAEQLATRLRLSQAAGGSQVQLSLKPRELGEVTVQMNVRDGAVAATILVDKADTLRTLQTNIEDLKKSLESQGLQIGEFSVDVRGETGAGGANARAAAELRDDAARASNGANASLAGAAAATPGLSGDREVAPEDVHDGDVSVLA